VCLRYSSVIAVACWLLRVHVRYYMCMLVIAGACWLLHVHVAYLRFNNHIRMHAKVENVNCSIS
jgi:hypothetical protein